MSIEYMYKRFVIETGYCAYFVDECEHNIWVAERMKACPAKCESPFVYILYRREYVSLGSPRTYKYVHICISESNWFLDRPLASMSLERFQFRFHKNAARQHSYLM